MKRMSEPEHLTRALEMWGTLVNRALQRSIDIHMSDSMDLKLSQHIWTALNGTIASNLRVSTETQLLEQLSDDFRDKESA